MARMSQRALQALLLSLDHWIRLRDGKEAKDEDTYGDYCALCKLYHARGCRGCPVAKKTNLTLCQGSPWLRARDAWNNRDTEPMVWRNASDEMVRFLQSLLPKPGDA